MGFYDISEEILRGLFILEPQSRLLKIGEKYEIEWKLFWHKDTDDFFAKLNNFKSYIDIKAVHYTVFEEEEIKFEIKSGLKGKPVVTLNGNDIECNKTDGVYTVKYKPSAAGNYKFKVNIDGICTFVKLIVKPDFSNCLKDV